MLGTLTSLLLLSCALLGRSLFSGNALLFGAIGTGNTILAGLFAFHPSQAIVLSFCAVDAILAQLLHAGDTIGNALSFSTALNTAPYSED